MLAIATIWSQLDGQRYSKAWTGSVGIRVFARYLVRINGPQPPAHGKMPRM